MNNDRLNCIEDEIKKLSNQCFEKNKSYSRVCGYFEVKLFEAIACLPKTKQEVFLGELKRYYYEEEKRK